MDDKKTEQLLNDVDEYKKVQKQAFDRLKNGYLNLARANYSNDRIGHYGKDNYNEKTMQSRISFDTSTLTTKKEKDSVKDPITMFGALSAPPALREAQTEFKQSVDELLKLVELQNRITINLDFISRDLKD